MTTTVLSASTEATRASAVRDKGRVGHLAGIIQRLSRLELSYGSIAKPINATG
jgi:hypothetical protein